MMQWLNIKDEHLQQILDWRTSAEITKYMYTDIPYDLDNQKRWLHSIQQDNNGRYWIMKYRDELIGFISITNIDWKHKRGYWNFYIGASKYAMFAGFLGAYVYNYAFKYLSLEKLMGEVMEFNESVRKLHLKQGAREVGCCEQHIYKNESWHNVYVYEMTKNRWNEVGSKYTKYMPEVELSQWEQ